MKISTTLGLLVFAIFFGIWWDLIGWDGVVEVVTYTVCYTIIIMIPFGIYLWWDAKREKTIDEFIKKHYRL